MPILNFGPRLKEFAYRPLELDWRINILEGSVRSGKTWALHPKILQACRYPVNGWKVLTGVSKQTIFNNVLNDLFNLVGPSNYTYNHQSGLLKLCGASWLVMGAKDEGSEKYVRGLTIGVVVADELTLMPREFFQMLLTRMSPDGARLYATTNPATPYHWLKVDENGGPAFLDDPTLRTKKLLWSGHYTMADNPNLTQEFIESQENMYTGVFYERFIKGRWVTAESSIYRDVLGPQCKYDDASRPIALLTSPAERYVFVDYGTVNPCVFLDVYGDGKTLYQEREYYWNSVKMRQQKTDAEYGDDFDAFIGEEKRGLVVIVDPSAASFKLELVRRGYQVKNGENEVLEGIRRVSSALKQGIYKIHTRCVETLKEHEGYAWNPKAAKRGEEEPIKERDHTCDAARVGICKAIPKWRLG
jgi:PBSX family phage terminase large subunit